MATNNQLAVIHILKKDYNISDTIYLNMLNRREFRNRLTAKPLGNDSMTLCHIRKVKDQEAASAIISSKSA